MNIMYMCVYNIYIHMYVVRKDEYLPWIEMGKTGIAL